MADSHLTKICTVCQEDKPLDQFYKQKGGKHGVTAMCKSCISEYRKNKVNSYVSDPSKPVPVKTCKTCLEEKPITDFHKSSSGTFGRHTYCKECRSQNNKTRSFTFDPDEFGENIKCSVCQELKHHTMFSNSKTSHNGKSYNCKACQSDIAAQKNNLPEENYEEKLRLCPTCGEEKLGSEFSKSKAKKGGLSSQCKECRSKYRKENLGSVNSLTARRRAIKKKAIPKWANRENIERIYEECAKVTKEAGIIHHVDHIVPLQSKWVCGLHCEDNLRVITGSDNTHKLNSHWPDMAKPKDHSVAATTENLARIAKGNGK